MNFSIKLLLFFALIMSMLSCSKQESYMLDVLSASELKLVHEDLLHEISMLDKSVQYSEHYFTQFQNTVFLVEQKGVEYLKSNKSIDPQVFDAFSLYRENLSKMNVYQFLAANFNLNIDQARQLFLIIELENYVIQNTLSKGEVTSRSCGLAVAFSIMHTLSAVTITTPAGLAFWLAGKAASYYGIYDSCK